MKNLIINHRAKILYKLNKLIMNKYKIIRLSKLNNINNNNRVINNN